MPDTLPVIEGRERSPAVPAGAHQALASRHLLLTLSGCETGRLDDLPTLTRLTERAALATGARVLRVVAERFEPQGVTVVALLAESHASLHTYPEHGIAYWDCFTCGQGCDPAASVAVVSAGLQPTTTAQQLIERTTPGQS